MKKTFLLFAAISSLCFLSIISYSQTPAWLWAKSAGGIVDDFTASVATDASGNAYIAGYFYSPTVTFDSITIIKNPAGNNNNLFLAKYNANGNILWAKSVGGTPYEYNNIVTSVAADASGNAYLTGYFNSITLSFDSIILINADSLNYAYNLFLAKYDPNGNVIWARSAGGPGPDWAYSIAADASGNAYVAGWFHSPTITFGSITLTNADNTGNTEDLFLAKYDVNGNILWAKRAGGTNDDRAQAVVTDVSGNTYLIGNFASPSISFGSTTLTNPLFLVKYNANGNVQWAKSADGTNSGVVSYISVDASGNTYLHGFFGGDSITFGSFTLINPNPGSTPILFLVKFDNGGNVQWLKEINSIIVSGDASGNTYGVGGIQNVGGNLTKYDSNGNILWSFITNSIHAQPYGSTVHTYVSIDATMNIYLAGWFMGDTLSFGPLDLFNVEHDGSRTDLFLTKLGSNTVINEFNNSLNISIYPDPASDNITIVIPQKATIEISNIQGQIIKSLKTKDNKTDIDISAFANGVYIIRAQTDSGITTKKFIKE